MWQDYQSTAESEVSFSYDLLGRVLNEQSTQGALNYDYDPMGNRTQIALPAGGGLGEVLGSMSWAPRHVTGLLTDGSPNVYINGRPAIRAHISTGECSEDGPAKKVVAQGSAKVYINDFPAARINDLLTCSAEIHTGSPNVIIGGEKEQTDDIEPEIPDWVNWTLLAAGVAATAVLAGPAIAIMSAARGMIGVELQVITLAEYGSAKEATVRNG